MTFVNEQLIIEHIKNEHVRNIDFVKLKNVIN